MYKYTSSSKYSLGNLRNDEIYMNHYESFNDPFECRCEVLSGFPKRGEDSSRLRDIFRAWGFEDTNCKVALESYRDLVFSLEGTEPNVSNIIDNARISCFSRGADNLLMWAHYADGLRGFCIEFDPNLILSKFTGDASIYDVVYQESPETIDTAVMAVTYDQIDYQEDAIYESQQQMKYLKRDNQAEIDLYEQALVEVVESNYEINKKMLATKPLNWNYEREIRVICQAMDPSKKGELLKYPPEAIKTVILGEKMPAIERDKLIGVLENRSSSIVLKEALRVEGEFKILLNQL